MITSTIQKNIKSFRISRGLSQKQLGEMVGKSDGTIADYERGRSDITISMLEKISKALNVPIFRMMDDDYNVDKPLYDESIKLRIYSKEDRKNVAVVLIENGYTVGQSKASRTPTGKTVDYFLHAKLDENNADTTK